MWGLIWHFADGRSFFVGAVLTLIAVLVSVVLVNRWRNLVIFPLVLIAAIEIIFSATPIALWFYCLWGVMIIAWLIFCNCFSVSRKMRFFLQISAACLCCIAMLIELPYHIGSRIEKNTSKTLYVIGDSILAGIGGIGEQTWPQILGKEHEIRVINLAQAGATATTAIRQAEQVQDPNAIVLIEIGGNDLLGPTATDEFSASLEEILSRVTSSPRAVIMLELPLLPLRNKYGQTQRKLAKKYGVILVPKGFFADILSTKNATVDRAHLSEEGHKLMAKKIWTIVGPVMQ